MPSTVERTLQLLALLQARPVWSGEELARRLEVTARTLRTDMNRLRELGYRIEGVPGAGGGYRLGPGDRLPPLLFDADESVAVLMGLRQLAGTGMDEAAEQAIAKVVRLLPPRLRSQAQAVAEFTEAGGTRGATVDPDLHTALTTACRERTRVRIEYRSRTGETTTREVEPYRVVGVRRRWYLLAWDTSREDWRTLRLDRMHLDTIAAPLFKPRPLPADDIAAYVLDRVDRTPWPYQAELIVQDASDRLVDRLPLNAVVEPITAHTSRVLLSADSPRHLAPWLSHLEADFHLADPDRDAELAREIQRVQQRYAAAATTAGARMPAARSADAGSAAENTHRS
ncbi:helix-turn-helix transcriptional regulator [Streptomyces arenae]|uniref:helix-turn-helix transcriptional regulator n=1 Tax=Streptomyces arenae TaxID=29301 RepID=UPI00265A5284|nr:YafY family protein [Streptomyces arenae]MCG7204438.1 YafY family transcriptional regulator [Streptomyces arenae]